VSSGDSAHRFSLSRRSAVLWGTAIPGAAVVAWGWGRFRRRRVSANLIDALVLAAEAIIALPVETSLYRDYFRWWVERSPAVRARYQRFIAVLDQEARALGVAFDEADTNQRRALTLDLARRRTSGDFIRVKAEILALFVRTDAWLQLGYESWPGTARGFINLDVLPRRAGL
jgi:hypothetical protein